MALTLLVRHFYLISRGCVRVPFLIPKVLDLLGVTPTNGQTPDPSAHFQSCVGRGHHLVELTTIHSVSSGRLPTQHPFYCIIPCTNFTLVYIQVYLLKVTRPALFSSTIRMSGQNRSMYPELSSSFLKLMIRRSELRNSELGGLRWTLYRIHKEQ